MKVRRPWMLMTNEYLERMYFSWDIHVYDVFVRGRSLFFGFCSSLAIVWIHVSAYSSPLFDFLRCFLCFTCRIFRLRSACAVIFAELTTVCTDALGHFHVYNIVYFTSRQERFYNLLYSMTPGQNLGAWYRRYLPELVLY